MQRLTPYFIFSLAKNTLYNEHFFHPLYLCYSLLKSRYSLCVENKALFEMTKEINFISNALSIRSYSLITY